MPRNDDLLRLIITEESVNDAEHLISLLRNHGLAVRPTQVNDSQALHDSLAAHGQDIYLCAPDMDSLPLEQALRELARSGKDVPLLVLTDAEDADLRAEAMAMGAVDLVSKAHENHFRLTVQRELANLRERRSVRLLEAKLRDSERRCQTLLETSRDAIAYVEDGMHIYANHSYLERFGYANVDALEGLPLLDLVAPEDQSRFKDFLRARENGQETAQEIELSVTDADGASETLQMRFTPATWDGEPCTQILIQAPGEHLALEEQLASLTHKDPQTGLYNRPFFVERLNEAISGILEAENAVQLELLYIEPDHLTTIRENVGITAVDRVLTDVAGIISSHLSDADTAARYTDTAFAVLLGGRGVHEAVSLAEAIRAEIEAHISEVDHRTITKTCSLGAMVVSDAVSNAQQALDLAHEACAVARTEGGNRVHLHSGAETEEGEAVDWRIRLRDALAGDGFRLLYQPIIGLMGDKIERFENRLRLIDDAGEAIAPDKFLPQADRLGLTPEVDLWVVRQTIKDLAERFSRGTETYAFVKISPATIGSQYFIDAMTNALQGTEVPGKLLILQVSEPIAVTQLNDAKRFFQAMSALGCQLSLEEFGSGLNSFQLLRHLPATYLKLDRSLTENLANDEESQRRVSEIIRNAHEMERQVIAGFLEHAMVLATLWQFQADLVQGHFLGEPSTEMSYDFSAMIL